MTDFVLRLEIGPTGSLKSVGAKLLTGGDEEASQAAEVSEIGVWHLGA